MGHFYFLLGLGALVLLLFGLSLTKRMARRHRLPFLAEETLFTPEQRAFLAVLERAVGKDYRIYGMVRVADVVSVLPRLDSRTRRRAQDQLWERRFDFLVCTAETSTIACAVNLAPRSRLRRRPPRDKLDQICAAARLPFVRFREGDLYSVVEIEDQVFAAMHARRIETRDVEPPKADTQQALHGLTEAIQEDGRAPLLPRSAEPIVPRSSRVKSKTNGSAVLQVADRPRSDPILVHDGAGADLDEGPAFSIAPGVDVDFAEDDRLARFGRV